METPPPSSGLDPAPVPPPQPPAPGGISEQQWIVFLNVSALAGLVLPSFGHILGPLIIWLIKKPESAAIDAAGRNVLNFQISWTIYAVIAGFSFFFCIGAFLFPVVVIAWLVFVIIGAIKASNGETYKFPLTIKML